MNELALFAGAGGGLLASRSLGWRTVCAVELDEYCRCVLIQRQNDGELRPGFPIWDDVRTFDGRPWRGLVHIVTGGFPCQAFSTAAAGNNTADDLWPEMRRVVADVAPWYVFAENVSRDAINAAADDLESMGYKTRALSLSAKTWVLTTFGAGTGFLHTPTTQANFCAPSMQKWSSCREWSRTFGVITPQNYEWLMGWPIGWTDLRPLETDKSRSAQQQHGESLLEACE